MRQRWAAVAAALVEAERSRLLGETEPPLSRLTARSIAVRYGLDWGTYTSAACGSARGAQTFSRAEQFLRVALRDAYRDGRLARLQWRSDGKWVRDAKQFVYVDAYVSNEWTSFGREFVPHVFGNARWQPGKTWEPNYFHEMTSEQQEQWRQYAASVGLVIPS